MVGTVDFGDAALGDLEGARALQEEVVAVYAASLPDGHPLLFTARHGLATSLWFSGELQAARELEEKVLADAAARLPDDSPLLECPVCAQKLQHLAPRRIGKGLEHTGHV